MVYVWCCIWFTILILSAEIPYRALCEGFYFFKTTKIAYQVG